MRFQTTNVLLADVLVLGNCVFYVVIPRNSHVMMVSQSSDSRVIFTTKLPAPFES